MPGKFPPDIRSMKIKIEAKDAEKYKGEKIRAKGEKLLLGEQTTKCALASEKSYAREQDKSQKEYSGAIKKAQKVIMNAFIENYMKLFGHREQPKSGFETDLLNLLPQLNNETMARLQVQVSSSETEQAIDELRQKITSTRWIERSFL